MNIFVRTRLVNGKTQYCINGSWLSSEEFSELSDACEYFGYKEVKKDLDLVLVYKKIKNIEGKINIKNNKTKRD